MDVFLLIYLAYRISLLAAKKGEPKNKWILTLVIGWVVGELIGVTIGLMIFEKENIFSWALVGLGLALTSYFLIFNKLEKLPDNSNDDINNIGNN